MIQPRTYLKVVLEENIRPSDRLKLWVDAYKSGYVARSVEADYRVVLSWVRSRNSRPPVLKTVKTIIGLSKERPLGIGPLDYADFYGEVSVKSYSVHPVARRKVSQSIEETSRPGRPRRKLPRNLKQDCPVENMAGTEVSKTFREFSEMPRTNFGFKSLPIFQRGKRRAI